MFIIFIFIIRCKINFFEEIEEWFDLFLSSLLFIIFFLFDNFNSDILSFFPVNYITESSFNFVSFNFELFCQCSVSKPFILTECEGNFKTFLTFSGDINSGDMFNQWLINFFNFFTDNIILNEGFEPIFREFVIFVIVVFKIWFF